MSPANVLETPPAAPEVVTPTVRAAFRAKRFWLFVGALALLIVVASSLLTATARGPVTPLNPTSPGPAGAKALVEVLRGHGVDVSLTTSLDDTLQALGDARGPATLLLHDVHNYLTGDQAAQLAGLPDDLVLIDPHYDLLDTLAPQVFPAGSVTGTLDADCALGAVQRADSVTGDGSGYRVDPGADALSCLGSDDDIYSLIQLDETATTVNVLGATAALSNETISRHGNAALALGLLGGHDTLVWYVPGIGDLSAVSAPTVAELTPDWVSPVLVLLVLVAGAAALAQGRRMGPLVVERLPVTVPAAETMEGRARLYQRSSDRLHALDAVRLGTVRRLARLCRLSPGDSLDAIIAATAALTGRDPAAVHALLVGAQPHTDRELIELSDRLLELERAATAATRPH